MIDKKDDALKLALEAHRALREWINAVPKDTPLPAMPGIDGDWLDEVDATICEALAEQPAQTNWNLVYLHSAMEYIREHHPQVYAECGDTDEFRADRLKELEQPAQQQEPVTRQYQGRDGVWKDFINEKHYKDTLEDGSWPIRDLYTSPQPSKPIGVKPWIGLTDKEKQNIKQANTSIGCFELNYNINGILADSEAKLREKNQ